MNLSLPTRKINLTEESVLIPASTELGGAEMAHIVDPREDCTSSWSTTTTEPEFEQSVIDSLPGELSIVIRLKAIGMLHTYQDVLSKHKYDLGRTALTEQRLDTGDARPIKQGLCRQTQTSLQVIDTFTENMERQHIIEKSASAWASNVVVVTKHDGTPRITLDYKALNNVTYKDSYPLPNMVDCLDRFRGSSWFGILDLRSSFYQVPLAEVGRDKTAFIARRGQWRFCALPMGFSNSSATFQRLRNLVLR